MGNGGTAPRILTSVIDGGVLWDSVPASFIPKETALSVPYIVGWVDRRPCLDAVEKMKNFLPFGFPTRSLVITPTELYLFHERQYYFRTFVL